MNKTVTSNIHTEIEVEVATQSSRTPGKTDSFRTDESFNQMDIEEVIPEDIQEMDLEDELDQDELREKEKEKERRMIQAIKKREAAELAEISRKEKEMEENMNQLLRQRTKKYRSKKSTIFFNG